jgi:hypothetical protein
MNPKISFLFGTHVLNLDGSAFNLGRVDEGSEYVSEQSLSLLHTEHTFTGFVLAGCLV